MSAHSDDHDRTMAFAEIALGQIKALGQPAYPRNYEVWYAYATGYNPALNQSINETLARKGTLSATDLDQIYDAHLSPVRLTERIDTVGAQVDIDVQAIFKHMEIFIAGAEQGLDIRAEFNISFHAF